MLIGNTEPFLDVAYGQSAKVRLYRRKIIEEGLEICFIELYNFSHHPLSILKKIKKGIKESDRIVLISAERGCKYLIPYINRINKKYKKPFALPLIGTSILHQSIDKLTDEQKNDFLVNGNYSLCKASNRLIKQLKRISYILPETEQLVKVFKEFYHLNNVFQLNNFRDFKQNECNKIVSNATQPLKMIFISRVMREKGIFDILNVAKKLHQNGANISLDIYGNTFLSKSEMQEFDSCLDASYINYFGPIKNDLVIDTMAKYDLFIFPTHCVGEGTPGVIVESLISGTPVISSNFPQAKYLLNDGQDSLLYSMFDNNSLYEKISYFCNNRNQIEHFNNNAKKTGEKYLYESQRIMFLKYICGIKGDGHNA